MAGEGGRELSHESFIYYLVWYHNLRGDNIDIIVFVADLGNEFAYMISHPLNKSNPYENAKTGIFVSILASVSSYSSY